VEKQTKRKEYSEIEDEGELEVMVLGNLCVENIEL
jgi:hypothetical protein